MCDFMQTNKEPTISIEQIDQTIDPKEKMQLIMQRIAEENQRAGGCLYLICTPDIASDVGPSTKFQSILSNLTWEYYYPEDVTKRPPVNFIVLEFNCVRSKVADAAYKKAGSKTTGIELSGRFDISADIEKIERHDATHDLHQAINRTGCFDITMKLTSLSYKNLRPRDVEGDKKDENAHDHFDPIFRLNNQIEIIWSAEKGVGRISGMAYNCYVPVILAPHDGFLPKQELLVCYQADKILYINSYSQPDGQIYFIGGQGGEMNDSKIKQDTD